MDESKSIQQTLSEALRRQGIRTIREAARATGLSEKTISGALSGTTTPTIDTLVKMASRLGLDPDSLVRLTLRGSVLRRRSSAQGRFFDEWDLVLARARALGEDVERDLLNRCDWYLRGAEAEARQGRKKKAVKPSRRRSTRSE